MWNAFIGCTDSGNPVSSFDFSSSRQCVDQLTLFVLADVIPDEKGVEVKQRNINVVCFVYYCFHLQ